MGVFAGADVGHAQVTAAVSDADLRYQTLWFECVSQLQILALRTGLDAAKPSDTAVAAMVGATDGLEKALVGLMQIEAPPVEAARLHMTVVLRLQEVVGAARDAIDALQKKDAVATEAALQWLDDALNDTNATMMRAVRGKF
ncbi:MAG: hypothetical protein WCP68_15390 [Enhydrobacter sp.]